jgi:hypothetical protein
MSVANTVICGGEVSKPRKISKCENGMKVRTVLRRHNSKILT